MQRRIGWAVALFAVATAATAELGNWLKAPLLGPAAALVVTVVGALLIGLAPGDRPVALPEPERPEEGGKRVEKGS
jgi:hypothetical protein